MTNRVVCDTGPLISLEKLDDGFSFIRKMYHTILVPPAVIEELTEGYDSPTHYLDQYEISDLIRVQQIDSLAPLEQQNRLHRGEVEAISLALKAQLPFS